MSQVTLMKCDVCGKVQGECPVERDEESPVLGENWYTVRDCETRRDINACCLAHLEDVVENEIAKLIPIEDEAGGSLGQYPKL